MALLARDIMTTDVETVHPDDEVSSVLTRLAQADFNGFPVVDEADHVVGIVTQGDLVEIFQPSHRTLWIPIGFPPFLESQTYGFDLSWNELDVNIDLVKNAGKPIRDVMTTDVVTVSPDDDLDHIIDLVTDVERDINRLPVVENNVLVGIITREDILIALRGERVP
ncbi:MULTISPECIES: CBS domain-containing protein [unclassified Haladaptatus]|uniref:CBS domain-containing protein n=1 Tax=unclassified Haladaptatus TaxID=2622732 RepID=UPI0023E7EF9F|nr:MULTISPECIES: CBS domain-containing protein [unclassified Haladaptatus]